MQYLIYTAFFIGFMVIVGVAYKMGYAECEKDMRTIWETNKEIRDDFYFKTEINYDSKRLQEAYAKTLQIVKIK